MKPSLPLGLAALAVLTAAAAPLPAGAMADAQAFQRAVAACMDDHGFSVE